MFSLRLVSKAMADTATAAKLARSMDFSVVEGKSCAVYLLHVTVLPRASVNTYNNSTAPTRISLASYVSFSALGTLFHYHVHLFPHSHPRTSFHSPHYPHPFLIFKRIQNIHT